MRTRLIASLLLFAASSGVVLPAVGPAGSAGAETPRPVFVAPSANALPIPAPYRATFTDDWHACRDGCARLHKGNDIFAPEGSPEIAVESGVIARVDNTDDGNGGLSLWLRGDSGVAYYYAHNSANLVRADQRVTRGQMIGRVGRTGNAKRTSPHIHFQINVCGELNSAEPCTVSPYSLLTAWSQVLIDGGPDAVGFYRRADDTFYRRTDEGSALPRLTVFDAATAVGPESAGTLPVAGDWDGDGRDTVGIYRRADATFRLHNEVDELRDAKLPDITFGRPGEADLMPVAGDWDGDGRDTLGLYQRVAGTFRVRDEQGRTRAPFAFATPGAGAVVPVAGDWDGDGRDTLGLYRRADDTFWVRDEEGRIRTPSSLPIPGAGKTLPMAGDWDGDGRDTLGLYRPADGTFWLQGGDGAPAGEDSGLVGLASTTRSGSDTSVASGSPSLPASRAVGPDAGAGAEPVRIEFGKAGYPDAFPVAGDWNGRNVVTLEDLRQIFGTLPREAKVAEGLAALNAVMLQGGITTPARKAAFLATLKNESGFRFDAVEGGASSTFRGRGLIQLTGVANYLGAGNHLDVALTEQPELAASQLVSQAVALWYWTIARDINLAADALDMAAVNIAIGYAPTDREDAERCADFKAALKYFSGGELPDGINCERTDESLRLALETMLGPLSDGSGEGPGQPDAVNSPTADDAASNRPPATSPSTTRPPATTTTTTTPRPPTTTTTTQPPSTTTTTTSTTSTSTTSTTSTTTTSTTTTTTTQPSTATPESTTPESTTPETTFTSTSQPPP